MKSKAFVNRNCKHTLVGSGKKMTCHIVTFDSNSSEVPVSRRSLTCLEIKLVLLCMAVQPLVSPASMLVMMMTTLYLFPDLEQAVLCPVMDFSSRRDHPYCGAVRGHEVFWRDLKV